MTPDGLWKLLSTLTAHEEWVGDIKISRGADGKPIVHFTQVIRDDGAVVLVTKPRDPVNSGAGIRFGPLSRRPGEKIY